MARLQLRIYEFLLQAVRFTCKKISFQGANAAKAPHLMRTLLSKRRQLCSFVEVIVVVVFKKGIELMPEVQFCSVPP